MYSPKETVQKNKGSILKDVDPNIKNSNPIIATLARVSSFFLYRS
jgi:hypothetical protein